MIYQLRFRNGAVERLDAEKALTNEQLASLNAGRAKLVAVDDHGNVAVLAEVSPKGDLMLTAEDSATQKGAEQ